MPSPDRSTQPWLSERIASLCMAVPVYGALALIALVSKLRTTPSWSDGTLERNHASLMSLAYFNNEQSRLLQFLVPEWLSRATGLSIPDAYATQRWVFVWASFVLFHVYLAGWFSGPLPFAGVCLLSATLPLTNMDHLQESAPLLMLVFLAALWAIRERRPILFAATLAIGALTNETVLCLPLLLFLTHLDAWRPGPVGRALALAVATAAPAFLITFAVRYLTRHQPHLGGAWHLPDNLDGIISQSFTPPWRYDHAPYMYPVLIYGPLWLYACLDLERKDRFLRISLVLVPVFIAAHLVTGIISEVRQMVPLGFIVLPSAMASLYTDPRTSPPTT